MPEVRGGWQSSGETKTSLKALRSCVYRKGEDPGRTAPLQPSEELTVGFLGRPACARGSRFPPPGFRPAATSSSASSFQPEGATRGRLLACPGWAVRSHTGAAAGGPSRDGGRERAPCRAARGGLWEAAYSGERTPRCAARPVSRCEPDPRVTDRVRSCPSDGRAPASWAPAPDPFVGAAAPRASPDTGRRGGCSWALAEPRPGPPLPPPP